MECIKRNLITRVLNFYLVKLTQSTALERDLSIASILSALPGLWLIGTLRSDDDDDDDDDGDGDGDANATKTIGSISKTTILHVHHAFLYISLPSLHDYDMKMPNSTMYRGNTQATTKFPLSF